MPAEAAADTALKGLRVLLVEDEFHVLLLLEDMLAEIGCEVAATAANLAEALDAAQACDVDAAVLDINLAGKKIYPVAAKLQKRGLPLVFSTGYGASGIDPQWSHYPLVQKPFLTDQLAQALREAVKAREKK